MWIIFVIQFEALHDYFPLIASSTFIEYKIKEVDDPNASSHQHTNLDKDIINTAVVLSQVLIILFKWQLTNILTVMSPIKCKRVNNFMLCFMPLSV